MWDFEGSEAATRGAGPWVCVSLHFCGPQCAQALDCVRVVVGRPCGLLAVTNALTTRVGVSIARAHGNPTSAPFRGNPRTALKTLFIEWKRSLNLRVEAV